MSNVGCPAIDRAADISVTSWSIDQDNPAIFDGFLNQLAVWTKNQFANPSYIITVTPVDATHFTSHDRVLIWGNVGSKMPAGYRKMIVDYNGTPIHLAVSAGDYIGVFGTLGSVEWDYEAPAGPGVLVASAVWPFTNQLFGAYYAGHANRMSVYGEIASAAGGADLMGLFGYGDRRAYYRRRSGGQLYIPGRDRGLVGHYKNRFFRR